jgi:hypothetical protein
MKRLSGVTLLAAALLAAIATGGGAQQRPQGFERSLQDLSAELRKALAAEQRALRAKTPARLKAQIRESQASLQAARALLAGPLELVPGTKALGRPINDALTADETARTKSLEDARPLLKRAIKFKQNALARRPKETGSGCQVASRNSMTTPEDDEIVVSACTRAVNQLSLVAIGSEITRFGQWAIGDRKGDCSRGSKSLIVCTLPAPLPTGEASFVVSFRGPQPGTRIEVLTVSSAQFHILTVAAS